MFTVAYNDHPSVHAWCVLFDGRHICRASSEAVARETAQLMQSSRQDHYR